MSAGQITSTEGGVREALCFEEPKPGGGGEGGGETSSNLGDFVTRLGCRSGSLLDQVEMSWSASLSFPGLSVSR